MNICACVFLNGSSVSTNLFHRFNIFVNNQKALKMEFRLVTVALMTIVTMSTLLALCVTETDARPSRSTAVGLPDGWNEYYRILQGVDERRRSVVVNECENSPEVRELCQRCAKATKSKMAYPLCCEQRLESRRFCYNFLNFGLTNRNDLNNS